LERSMPNEGFPEDLGLEEFRQLRATIRERGSLRHLLVMITFCVWAATMLWAAITLAAPVLGLVPLMVLAAGFEVGLALHVGVERIGRYLQVRYEKGEPGSAGWERTAMELRVPTGGIDPLFLKAFVAAANLNLLVGIWTASVEMPLEEAGLASAELLVFLGLHIAVVVRWLWAARYARTQRVRELAAFETLLKRRD
jgi:hypothetical protein